MVVFPPSQSPADSIGKPSRSESSTTSSSGQNHPMQPHSSSPMSTGTFGMTTFPITSTPLPPSPSDPKFTTWATVSATGARLSVPDSGVFLTIPPGALNIGHTVDVFLSVLHGGNQHPQLNGRDTLLSPIVACGPREASIKLKKPAILTLPHCASLRHGNWSVSVLQNDELNGNSWHKVVTLGQETINTPVYAQLDLNSCHVMTDHLACFALTGESAQTGHATKSLRLAAFAQEGQPAADLTVRVYCLPDTDDSLSFVCESEKRYNGRILDKPISVLMQDGGDNLCLEVEGLSSNWSCQKGADYLEVPFYHVWNSANPTLHCSFTFRSVSNAPRGTNNNANSARLNFTLGISQKNANSSHNKSLLSVTCDLNQPQNNLNQLHRLHQQTYEMSTSVKFRLTQPILQALSGLLDPPNQQGNDWRLLAERLNVHRYVTYFATRSSPTEAILQLWEARNREVLAVSNLINVLRGMGRFDAANLLESGAINNN